MRFRFNDYNDFEHAARRVRVHRVVWDHSSIGMFASLRFAGRTFRFYISGRGEAAANDRAGSRRND